MAVKNTQTTSSEELELNPAKVGLLIGGAVALLITLAILIPSLIGKVPPGHVGIKVDNLGSAEIKEVGVGYTYLGFFSDLYLFPTFKQNYVWTKEIVDGDDADESITFQTKEGMLVNADFGVSFTIDASKATDLFQTYRRGINEITDVFVRNHLRDAVNEAAASMTVEQIYGTGKTELLNKAQAAVSDKVKAAGLNIEEIYAVGAFRFPESFINSLNSKLEAQQRATQRENEVREAEAQAKKDVAKAEGEARAQVARAEGEAKAIMATAKATAEAIRLKQQSITAKLIEYEKVQKWNGTVPQISGGATPIIDLRSKGSAAAAAATEE